MASRDREIRMVAAELDQLLDQLADSVNALNAVLYPPQSPESSKEAFPP